MDAWDVDANGATEAGIELVVQLAAMGTLAGQRRVDWAERYWNCSDESAASSTGDPTRTWTGDVGAGLIGVDAAGCCLSARSLGDVNPSMLVNREAPVRPSSDDDRLLFLF